MSESEIDALLGDDELEEETPPEPSESQEPLTLEQRLNLAYSLLNPEQKARYDEATKQIMDMPVMQAFAENEERHDSQMEQYRKELLKRMKK